MLGMNKEDMKSAMEHIMAPAPKYVVVSNSEFLATASHRDAVMEGIYGNIDPTDEVYRTVTLEVSRVTGGGVNEPLEFETVKEHDGMTFVGETLEEAQKACDDFKLEHGYTKLMKRVDGRLVEA